MRDFRIHDGLHTMDVADVNSMPNFMGHHRKKRFFAEYTVTAIDQYVLRSAITGMRKKTLPPMCFQRDQSDQYESAVVLATEGKILSLKLVLSQAFRRT